MPCAWPRPLHPPENPNLILLIGYSESGFEPDVRAELAQKLRAEGVDRTARYLVGGRTEILFETMRDLTRSLVGEREGTDARGIVAVALDQEADALREAERLPRTWTGQHQQGARFGFDRKSLGRRRDDTLGGNDTGCSHGDA